MGGRICVFCCRAMGGPGAAGAVGGSSPGTGDWAGSFSANPAINATATAHRRNVLDTSTPLQSSSGHERAATLKSTIPASDCGFDAASAVLLSVPTTLKIAQYDVNNDSSYSKATITTADGDSDAACDDHDRR
jgi:hypothetical protein